MAETAMTVDGGPDPILRFTPSQAADFKEVNLPIPELRDVIDELRFQTDTTMLVRRACGKVTCRAEVRFSFAASIIEATGKLVIGALIVCNASDCPIEGPDSAGDREPRVPLPKGPGEQLIMKPLVFS